MLYVEEFIKYISKVSGFPFEKSAFTERRSKLEKKQKSTRNRKKKKLSEPNTPPHRKKEFESARILHWVE